MKAPEEIPTVQLVGSDGNAFAVMGKVRKALQYAGADSEYINQYLGEAMAGDYDHLLGVSMKYVDVI